MILLLDTNAISALRRPERAPQVAAWLRGQSEDQLFLSAITLGEIERGIRLQAARNPEFARDLRFWLDRTMLIFSDRILPFDSAAARIWGALSARIGHDGADLMIAVTDLAQERAVVTSNVDDFVSTGVRVINPF